MQILFLSPRQCWPAQSGAKLREYHLLQALSARADVHFAYFADPVVAPPERSVFSECRAVLAVPKPPMYRPTQLLQGLLTHWPLPVINYTSAAMESAVCNLRAGAGPFDLVHLDSIHMVRYPGALPATDGSPRVVFNWHNIESEAMQRYGNTIRSFTRKIYAHHTAGKLRRLEAQILRDAFGHLVCSEREQQQLLDLVPGARVAVIENGVDCSYFAEPVTLGDAPESTPSPAEPRFVFVGSMDYYPNMDAILHFVSHTWPRVKQRLPRAKLDVVGARPGAAVRALGRQDGIHVTGTVPDVRPYYQRAVASIVPLRTGGGTRLKILESMAAGIPIISTQLGAEGLAVQPGHHFLLASDNDSETWAQHMAMLATDAAQRKTLANTGETLAKQRYDWPVVGRKLVETYQRWLAETGTQQPAAKP
jgi:polysaccharide biosynthesis protein PslH